MQNKNKFRFNVILILGMLLLTSFAYAQNAPPLSFEEEKELVRSASMQNSGNALYQTATDENHKGLKVSWFYVAAPLGLILLFLAVVEVKRKTDHLRLLSWHRSNKDEALKTYVSTNLKKGFSKEQIRSALIKNNYNQKEVEEAFKGMK